MRSLLLLAAAGVASAAVYSGTDDDFPNPERGFYVQSAYHEDRPRPLDPAVLRKVRAEGLSLLRMYWVLSNSREGPLSDALLARVHEDFGKARAAGLKVIGRFAYNFGPTGAPDAPLERVLGHLDQLKPVLRANSDVLAFLEAGFIGTWGEWHHSTNGLLDHTREIVDRILDVLPADRMLALRYPRLKTNLYGTDPLTAAEAFSALPKARVGAHNDCFLASKTDWGTWSKNVAAEKAFYHQDNLFVPQGGETCNFKEDAQPFVGCENALKELAYQRFNTLNIGYEKNVLEGWKTGGCMPEIRRRLGYRLRFEKSSVSVRGNEVRVSVQVANDGFGNLFNPRPVEVLLRERTTGALLRSRVGADPRRWMPGGSSQFEARIQAPHGTYDVLVRLPDAAESIAGQPEYAVRFANPGVWEPESGMNRLDGVAAVRRR